MEQNYLTLERDEWIACRKGKCTSSDIYRLFHSGTRPMTQEELDARPKKKLKDGSDGKQFEGGTTVPVLFGGGAINYIREKIDELISGNPTGGEEAYPSVSELKQTEWGNSNEYDALRHFEIITGKSVIYYGGSSPRFFYYGDYSGCSPDGEIVLEDAAIEIKCPYNTAIHTERLLYKTVDEFKENEKKEWMQCQCIMKILGKPLMYFCSYDPRKSFKHLWMKIIKVKADAEWQTEFDFRLSEAAKVMKTMLQDSEKYLIIE